MRKNNSSTGRARNTRWSDADRFAFATQRLRASTIPSRRPDGPTADEWADDEDAETD